MATVTIRLRESPVTFLFDPSSLLGGVSARTDYTITIPLATSGDWEVGSFDAVKGGQLLRMRSTQSCAVRLYRDADARDADLTRDYTTLPTPGSGVLAETWLAAANDLNQWQSPAAFLYNADSTVAATIYWAVMNNMDSDLPITVTITILPLEA